MNLYAYIPIVVIAFLLIGYAALLQWEFLRNRAYRRPPSTPEPSVDMKVEPELVLPHPATSAEFHFAVNPPPTPLEPPKHYWSQPPATWQVTTTPKPKAKPKRKPKKKPAT